MEMLHELLAWLSQEGLAREGLYIFGAIIMVIVLKGGTEGIIDFFLRKGRKNEKTD